MKTQSCKAKGRRLQQMIVSELLEIFEHLNCDDIRSTSMGASGEDIQLSAAARLSLPYSFEAKNQEKVNIWSALEQAKTNTPPNCDPVVVFKKNGQKPHVMISWDLFKRMICPKEHQTEKQKLLAIAQHLQEVANSL